MKRVKCKNHMLFQPRQVYCYCSIKKSYTILMENNPDFWRMCNKWRVGETRTGMILSDVYDRQVWTDFQVYKGRKFLADKHNLGFMLNVDWFRPFDHTTHSVGVLYLSIINLPRHIRFKFPYVLIVGVIPPPHEPSGIINTFLGPMVKELVDLWQGCWLGSSSFCRCVRAALLCVSCDLPTARNVGGIVGHSALMGCSRCTKKFRTAAFGEKADYGGFKVENWIPRPDEEQQKCAYNHFYGANTS